MAPAPASPLIEAAGVGVRIGRHELLSGVDLEPLRRARSCR